MRTGIQGNRLCSRVAAVLFATVLAETLGCTSDPPEPVQINDSHAPTRSARVVWRPGDRAPREQRGGFEIDYARHRASGTQNLATGQRIVVGSATLNGPDTIRHEADSRYLHAVYNHLTATSLHLTPGDAVEAEFLIGMGLLNLSLRSESTATTAPALLADRHLGGIVLGLAPRWRFSEYLAAEARYTILTNFFEHRDAAEIALELRPVRKLVLRAGYNRTIQRIGVTEDVESNVHADLHGPFLGLTLDF